VGTAVQKVCLKVRDKLLKLAHAHPAFAGVDKEDITFAKGACTLVSDPSRHLHLTHLMKDSGTQKIERSSMALPHMLKQRKFTKQSHSAVFAEVVVDEDTRMVRVTRVVSAIAGGRILNPKTARSQILGGVVWGIGAALQEETVLDHRLGKIVTRTLADYHFPVHADIGEIEVIFVEEKDEVVNPLGVKGLGEIGIVGVAAAIANAVYHATGKRVRNLPITPDKLM
ncbi:MAG: xanthine dehydrogenase family protein molybdopterin-binding subunit, partial [Verrucomicrobiaceae bacterium]